MEKYLFTESQIKTVIDDLYLRLLFEQLDDPDRPDDPEYFPFGQPEPQPEPGQPEPDHQQPQQPQQPRAPRQLSANQMIMVKLKKKWKEENPGIDDEQMENAIQFFNNRKNGIRPIKDPAPQGQPNQMEIIALKTRFPNMTPILIDPVRIRDIGNYTWAQIDYYIDRASAVEMDEQISYEIDETSEETQFKTAMTIWNDFPKKVINENNIILCRVECKEEAMALGRLQNLLSKKYGGNAWCITYLPDRYGTVNNNWAPYRKEKRAFYFILDKNKPERDPDYVAVIETTQRGSNSTNHNYTARPNGTEFTISWQQIARKHQINGQATSPLEGKEHLLPYFDLTSKELEGADLNRITFRENTDENPNPYDFVLQKKQVQQRYVEDPHRSIPNKRAFSVLTPDLRRSYIGATTATNLSIRYRCDDPTDPFGILNMVGEDRQLLKTLEWHIINQLQRPDGLMAIQKPILKLGMREGLNDKDKKLVLYRQKDGDKYGVINIQTIKWEKPVSYIRTKTLSLIKMEEGKMLNFRLQRYALENAEDYFYFFYNGDALLNPKSPHYMLGKYFTKVEGDDFLEHLSDLGFRTFSKT